MRTTYASLAALVLAVGACSTSDDTDMGAPGGSSMSFESFSEARDCPKMQDRMIANARAGRSNFDLVMEFQDRCSWWSWKNRDG